MQLGMIGLGKMGGNLTRRLQRGGHQVVAYDRMPALAQQMIKEGAEGASSLGELVSKLTLPRTVWIMVPAGDPTESTIGALIPLLSSGDVVIDGGNANYKDTVRRGELLREHGLHLVDAGTSGGIWGLAEGYSLMVGGDQAVIERLRPIFETLAPAPDKGWGRVGPTGAGHFVKMVHNGIEYALMQSYAEGLEILQAKEDLDLDLHAVTEIWRYGSVIRSWLLDLIAGILKDDQALSDVKGYVPDSGEGRWTVAEAVDLDVPAPIITLSLLMRFVSRQDDSYAAKLLAAMRRGFGGHAVERVAQRSGRGQ